MELLPQTLQRGSAPLHSRWGHSPQTPFCPPYSAIFWVGHWSVSCRTQRLRRLSPGYDVSLWSRHPACIPACPPSSHADVCRRGWFFNAITSVQLNSHRAHAVFTAMPRASVFLIDGAKVRRYNWHSAGSLRWPFPTVKYKYTFQIKYTESVLSNSTRKLLRFEITKLLIAVLKINLLCHLV